MAKKKSQPNQQKKDKSGKSIRIELERRRARSPIKPCQRFRSREREERRGHTRKRKHKKRHDDA